MSGTRRELRWGKQLEAVAVPILAIIYEAVTQLDCMVGVEVGACGGSIAEERKLGDRAGGC